MDAFLLFTGGLILLLIAGEILAALTIALARRLGFLPFTIALTVTALATSAPEIFVSAIAALEEAPALALGNVAGSNISNQWLVLGLAALFAPLVVGTPFLRRNGLFAFAATLLAALLAGLGASLSRADGALLLFAALLWLIYTFQSGKAGQNHRREESEDEALPAGLAFRATAQPAIAFFAFMLAVVGLAAGAHLALRGAEGMAALLHIPDAVIGLTALAIGTSLPELATSLAAARRGHAGIILGNILGSTVLNCFVVLGIAALLYPIPAEAQFIEIHFPIAALACFSLLPFLFFRRNVGPAAGTAFLALYAAYIFYIF